MKKKIIIFLLINLLINALIIFNQYVIFLLIITLVTYVYYDYIENKYNTYLIADNFISLSLQGYYFLNKEEDYLSFAYNYLPKSLQKEVEKDKLNLLEITFKYLPFSIFMEIINEENIKKENRINALKKVLDFSSFLLNNEYQKNIDKVLISIIEYNLIFLILKLFINVNYIDLYFVIFLIVYLLECIFLTMYFKKMYSLNNNYLKQSMLIFFIYLEFHNPFFSFEKSLDVLDKKQIVEYKKLLDASYNHDESIFIKFKNKCKDKLTEDYIMLIYHLTYTNSVKTYDNKSIELMYQQVLKQEQNTSFKFDYLFLITLIINVYYILVNYGKI